MDTLEGALIVASAGLAGFGLLSLAIVWLAPGIAGGRFFRWMLTGSRIAPTRANQTLMALWSMLVGLYIFLSRTHHDTASYIVFAVWIPVCWLVLRSRRFVRQEPS